MSFYRFRYVVETSLQSEKETAFEHQGQRIMFSFPPKGSEESAAKATLEVEAANWREADVTAQSFLQPVLDALAFATSSPLIVLYWDFVLKDEAGNARKALWFEATKRPARFQLAQSEVEAAQKILSQEGGPELPLCWHRYALQRELILDRFVFQWLAFEGLAGSRQIPTTCPRCGTEVAHCEKALSHEGSDRQNAYQLWSRVEPNTSIQEFTRQVWGRARNSVFHGSKYPGPELLTSLNALFPKLRRASESELSRQYGLPDEVRPIRVLDWRSHRFNMFGWQTANAQDRFAGDFPWDSVAKEFSNWKDGEVRIADTSSWPFKVLDFAKESANW
jgi:hypothetical protein